MRVHPMDLVMRCRAILPTALAMLWWCVSNRWSKILKIWYVKESTKVIISLFLYEEHVISVVDRSEGYYLVTL